MSNRLRRMGRFEREEQRRGERWAYIVYGLSADARTDSARLKQIDHIHHRRAQRALLMRLDAEADASIEAYIGRRMDDLRSEGWTNVRYVDGVIRGDAPKPKRSLVEVVDKLMMIGFSAGLTALLLAWFMGWALG